MYYLVINYAESNPKFNDFIFGKIEEKNADFYALSSKAAEMVTDNEKDQCEVSLFAIGSYYTSNYKLSIVDDLELEKVYPELRP